jgi:mRNA-degrading endonuclease RelE of RelBE toxin-antitoxin system
VARVLLSTDAARELDALDRAVHYRILRVLERLERWPHVSGAKALRHALAGRHRIRTGDYRVQFYVEGDTVVVERIGHRDGFYEE